MLKVGVIGVGHLGRYHAEKYRAIGDVELVGVADIQSRRADGVAERLGVRAFYHHQDLLDLVDVVSVAVPTMEHYSVTRDFLEAGVHVLVEKPITRTLEEADKLIALAAKNGLVVQVGHLERFNPAIKAVAGLTEGRPLFIESNRISPFTERGTDVDVILDLMIHDIDITLILAREEPNLVQAIGVPVITPMVDIANARLEFDSGCVANLTASRIAGKSLRNVRIFHQDSYFSIDYRTRQVWIVRRTPPDASGRPGTKGEPLAIPESDALEEEIKSFVSSVTSGSAPEVSAEEGRRALAVAHRILADIEVRQKDRPSGPERD